VAGLSAGESVITEGLQKVHPGEVVNPSTPTVLPGESESQSGSPATKG
jgi:hypothetical protein